MEEKQRDSLMSPPEPRYNKAQLLQNEHPDVSLASPRPGGIITRTVIEDISPEERYANYTSRRGHDLSATNSRISTNTTNQSITSGKSKPKYNESQAISNTSRLYRVSRLADEWVEPSYENPEPSSSRLSAEMFNRCQNSAIKALQVVMLLANGQSVIKEDVAVTAYIFLKNVKDDNGLIAPNCHRVVNHLVQIGIEKVLRKFNLNLDGKPIVRYEPQIVSPRNGFTEEDI